MKTLKLSQLFATSWQELTPAQFLQIMQLKELLAKNERPKNAAFVRTSMLWAVCRNLKAFKKLTDSQIIDCFEALDFIDQPCLTFLVKSFELGDQIYLAPEDRLFNCNFLQISEADAEFSKYMITQESQYLIELCKKLYTSTSLSTGTSTSSSPLSGVEVDEVAEVPEINQLTIFYNYAACRQYFTNRCPNLFPKPADDEKQDPVYTGEMWRDLLYDLSETPTFSGLEVAKTANLYEALDYLEKKQKEAIETRRKMKRPH